MSETGLSGAIRGAVEQWTQTTAPEQQQLEMAYPATLSAVLGLMAQEKLSPTGRTLGALREHVLKTPYTHLRNVFDAHALVDTPTGFFPIPSTAATLSGRAAALAVHGLLRLETVSYRSENEGHLFANLVAMPGVGVLAEKSKKDMRGHTDGVSFPFNGEDDPQNVRIAPSPDLVTLVGLRNPAQTPTKVMTLSSVLAILSPADVEELKKPQYGIRSQKTFIAGMKMILGSELVVLGAPVLRDSAAGTVIRFSHNSVTASEGGGAAEQALQNLIAACNQVAAPVIVGSGDILIINNRLSLHGRGKVGDDVGGQSRWVLRTYGLDTSDLPAHKRHLAGAPPHILFP